MNNLLRFTTFPTLNALKSSFNNIGKREFTRTLWYMCKSPELTPKPVQHPSLTCTCGCNSKLIHTKGKLIIKIYKKRKRKYFLLITLNL